MTSFIPVNAAQPFPRGSAHGAVTQLVVSSGFPRYILPSCAARFWEKLVKALKREIPTHPPPPGASAEPAPACAEAAEGTRGPEGRKHAAPPPRPGGTGGEAARSSKMRSRGQGRGRGHAPAAGKGPSPKVPPGSAAGPARPGPASALGAARARARCGA